MITEIEIINILSNPENYCPSKIEQWRRSAKAIIEKIKENEKTYDRFIKRVKKSHMPTKLLK